MFTLIDIHCHILPGVDDGPKTLEDSLDMARAAVDNGITTIIATPHFNCFFENKKVDILKKVVQLNERIREENIPLTILPGKEIAIYGDIIEDLEKGIIQSLCDTQYIFIELPLNHVPKYIDKLIYNLQVKKFVPIIVHPERNVQIVKQPELLYRLVKHGALTQITAASLVRGFGKETMKFTEKLIEANLVHFIASDAHNVGSRGFKLAEAYARVDKLYGTEYLYLLIENTELLVQGKMVNKLVPEHVRLKRIFSIF